MRMINALRADVRSQFKQGFYTIYMILTLVYMVVLSKMPAAWKSTAVPLLVFSDPSMVGFFFIGALIMLEKVQGVIQYVQVTPLRSMEYLLAKAVSLTLLALAATVTITLATYGYQVNWPLLLIAVSLSSIFFVFYGFIVAIRCTSLNQYFVRMIPYLLLIVLPCFSLIGFPFSWLFNVFPSVVGLRLVMGAFQGISNFHSLIMIGYLLVCNWFIARHVEKIFDRIPTEGI